MKRKEREGNQLGGTVEGKEVRKKQARTT